VVSAQVATNSAQMTSADNAISNAVSVVSAAQLSTWNALSNEISVRAAASAALESHINTVSNAVSSFANAISVVSAAAASIETHVNTVSAAAASIESHVNTVSAAAASIETHVNTVSNAVSVVSAQVATNSAQMVSADNAISNAVSVVSAAQLSTWNALSNEISVRGAASADLKSAINVVSNAVSVVSAQVATNSAQMVSADNAISNAVSIVSAAQLSTWNKVSAILTSSTTFSGATYTFSGSTASTNTVTGAVVITGGLGVGGNINAANISIVGNTIATTNSNGNLVLQPNGTGATVINDSGATSNFVVKGDTDAALIFVDATNDNVGIGTATPNTGAKLHINATSSMILPKGTTGERPGVGVVTAGMIRFNTSSNDLEFYNGTSWGGTGSTFTIIADDKFTGDGSTVIFTLSSAQTTNSCIVSINGIVQIPSDAYGVTGGTTLTFTEAPAAGDIIDVREITTTTTIASLASANGYNVVELTNAGGVIFSSGTSSVVERWRIDTSGNYLPSANASYSIGNATSIVSTLWVNEIDSGNIIPRANAVHSLGNVTNQWKDLYLAGSTLYLANVAITSDGSKVTIPNLTVTGSMVLGNVGNVIPSANITYNLGTTTARWLNVWASTFNGTATTAQYADLAEKYLADAEYEPGTVMVFGGAAEITLANTDSDRRVAGVVSNKPAYLMNSELEGQFVTDLALLGRVPCKVIGPIQKGDMLIVAGNGHARSEANPVTGSVIGKALENFEGTSGVIEIVVGRM
jgi:predicted  nucleic acid-binding Zn-ribbon protein